MKRFFFASGLVLLLTLAGTDARAQTGTARGRILDEQGQPLADVKVDIEFKGGITRKLTATTNKKGEYTQVGLQPGEYRFTANKEGYQSGYVEIRVNLGDTTGIPEMKLRSLQAAKKAAADASGLAGSFKAAADLLQAGKLAEAEAAFQELGTKHPGIPQIQFNLGQLYLRKGDSAAAEAAFSKSLEADATYTDGYVGLSNLYLGSRQLDKAFEFTQKAAVDHAEDARLQLQLGVVCFNTSKYDEAAAALTKALQLNPAMADANYYLGTISVSQNKIPEAVAYLEKFLASDPPAGQNKDAATGLLGYLKPKK